MISIQHLITILFSSILFISFVGIKSNNPPYKQYEINGRAQGTTYSIKYISAFSLVTKYEIDSLLQVVDQSLSLYNENSLISKFNRNQIKIEMDDHLKNVIQLSQQISIETNQAFDFTLKPISYAWGFQNKKKSRKPSQLKLNRALNYTGPSQVYFENAYLVKKNKHVQIDCDGIAQGYTVDCISSFFKAKGIQHFLIELGGEIAAQGKNLNNECWTISLSTETKSLSSNLNQNALALCDQAITTSGKFSKSVQIQQEQKSHIINPQTGKPIENTIRAVTVIANHAAYADALDNAFMVMGIEKTWKWLEGKNNIGVLFVYQTPEGSILDTSNAFFTKHKIK